MTLVEFRQLFDIFKVYANTMRRYKPGQFQGRITLFRPADEFGQVVFSSNTEKAEQDKFDGWSLLATEGVEVRNVPGNHFSMLQEPHVQILGEQLRQCIEAARAQRNGSNA